MEIKLWLGGEKRQGDQFSDRKYLDLVNYLIQFEFYIQKLKNIFLLYQLLSVFSSVMP